MSKGQKKVAKAKAKAKVQAAKGEVTPAVEKTEVVTVDQTQAPFNRAGMDALNMSLIGPGKAVVAEAPVEKKPVQARINDGFLGMTRKMYRAGKNGQEILEANVNARLATGNYTPEKAMIRAKKDYGFVQREAKAEKKAEAPAEASAANA